MTKRKPGCTCGLLCVALVASFSIVVILALSNDPTPAPGVPNRSDDSPPFVFLRSQTDAEGSVMDLYTFEGKSLASEFEFFATKLMRTKQPGGFYYAVVFDSADNAVFPSNPFTALFGMDVSVMSHVRGYFEFNPLNGFAQVTTYERNMASSKPNSKNIR